VNLPWSAERVVDPPAPEDNPTTRAKSALGRLLFYDPIVSSDRQTACATCHSEVWGMSDGLDRSVGNAGGLIAGPGRTGSNRTRRNSQALWNVAYKRELFWDGRASSLEEQALFPFDAPEELNRAPDDVLKEIGLVTEYRALFEEAFPDAPNPVSVESVAAALAAFQRTLTSRNALYDSYVEGDLGALSEKMVDGMFLFAEAGCDDCHAPPLFGSDRYSNRGIQPVDGIDDLGRFEVTGREEDRNAFSVPTLRNARETAPYFHTGDVQDLASAIEREIDFSVTHDGIRAPSDSEISAIQEFVTKALVDRSADPDRPDTVPSGYAVPIDNTRLLR
jgi:cytochrome c peroxidase